jgi:hypothetical protein
VEFTSRIRTLMRVLLTRRPVLTVLAAGLLSFSSSAWAQISLVHVTSCGPGTFPGTTCTIPSTGTGNLIVVGLQLTSPGSTSTTISGVTDNAGNAYSEAGAARSIDTASGAMVDIWYAKNCVLGATSVTITPSASTPNAAAVIWEFSGIDRIAPLDQTAVLNNQAASATPSGGAVTTTAAVEVVVSLIAGAQSFTGISSGNPFTSDSNVLSNGWAHLITSSTGTYSAKWNENPAGTYVNSTASFKAASGGVPLNACDLAPPYGTIDQSDVSAAVNMVLNPATCTANIQAPGVCDIVTVQRVVNAALTGTCVTGTGSQTWSISGTISPVAAGTGVTVTLSGGASTTATTDASGNYIFSGLMNGTYTATPSKTGYTFSPASQPVTISGANQTAINFTAVSSIPHSVTLNWVASTSSNVTGSNIYRATTSGGPYTKISSSPGNATSYVDSVVQSGLTYYYVVTAVDSSGNESAYSNQAQAVIPSP